MAKTPAAALTALLLLRVPRLHAAGPAPSAPDAAGEGGVGRPNLILIGWDTLRADHVAALGYKRKTTPNLDAFAAGSCLFTGADSPAFAGFETSFPQALDWLKSGADGRFFLFYRGYCGHL